MRSTTIVSLFLTLLPTYCFAKSLRCEIKEGNVPVFSTQIETAPYTKYELGKTPNVIAYVKDFDNANFTLEGLLVKYQARFYSSGVLKSKNDTLIASLWSRDVLVDIQCTLL